jgi:preprotein translocase subunit SecE
MSSKAEAKSSPFNILKWSLVVVLVAAAVVGNQYYSDESLLYRVLAMVAIGAVAVFVALATTQGVAFATLVKGARIEIRKVVWPTRPETLQTTFIVLGVVLIAALILWGLDSFLGWIASLIIG